MRKKEYTHKELLGAALIVLAGWALLCLASFVICPL